MDDMNHRRTTRMLDVETKALEAHHDHKAELRLWLRLLALTNLVEGEIRRRLRAHFEVTLPRFDLMAQLQRAPGGMTLSEVSRRMMVSNGNVTGLVDTLMASGHLERQTAPHDRRAQVIRLTLRGRREFARMAAEHEEWVATFFADLKPREVQDLIALLGKAKISLLKETSLLKEASPLKAAPSREKTSVRKEMRR